MVLKATLVSIFGPNLKTKTLLRPRPKLNKNGFVFNTLDAYILLTLITDPNKTKYSSSAFIYKILPKRKDLFLPAFH